MGTTIHETEIGSRLSDVITSVVAPQARDVDRDGSYPAAAVQALGTAGALSLLSAPEVGGPGLSLRAAAEVVERLARTCASTAMVVTMHFAATAVLEKYGPVDVRRAIASGEHLSTLAFSETGSRSHFWAPVGTAAAQGDHVELNASKSWVTAAGEADSYVWSSRPVAERGAMTLWLVPCQAEGLSVSGGFDGLGLRGNASKPMAARHLLLPRTAMLGRDGDGLNIALELALPTFLVLTAAFSIGLAEALLVDAAAHLTGTHLTHLAQTLAQQPNNRASFARLRTRTDEAHALCADALAALEEGRPDASLRVLQVKAVAAEAAVEVGDGVMRMCGGSAIRRELNIERHFRDTLAARVMAPTTDALHDFIGRACLGLPLFDEEPTA